MATEDSFWQKHGLKLAVSVVIALAFVWTFRRGGLPLIPPASAIAKVPLSTYVEYVALVHRLRTWPVRPGGGTC